MACLVGVDEVAPANRSRSPASVGRRTRVTPARYRSRLGTPACAVNRSNGKDSKAPFAGTEVLRGRLQIGMSHARAARAALNCVAEWV